MKQNTQNKWLLPIWISVFVRFVLICILSGSIVRMMADESNQSKIHDFEGIAGGNAPIYSDDIIASVYIVSSANTNGLMWGERPFAVWDEVSVVWHSQQVKLVSQLTQVLTNLKSADINKCAAADYLGNMRASKAVDALAANITLQFGSGGSPPHRLPRWFPGDYVSVWALEEIGNPSIPAVIRNLAESDDAKVRELSLQVLCSIEGDKDIVQLRLQKALNAEKDPQKQARLQSALKSLAEMSFRN